MGERVFSLQKFWVHYPFITTEMTASALNDITALGQFVPLTLVPGFKHFGSFVIYTTSYWEINFLYISVSTFIIMNFIIIFLIPIWDSPFSEVCTLLFLARGKSTQTGPSKGFRSCSYRPWFYYTSSLLIVYRTCVLVRHLYPESLVYFSRE